MAEVSFHNVKSIVAVADQSRQTIWLDLRIDTKDGRSIVTVFMDDYETARRIADAVNGVAVEAA
jgi:hypothetical protein